MVIRSDLKCVASDINEQHNKVVALESQKEDISRQIKASKNLLRLSPSGRQSPNAGSSSILSTHPLSAEDAAKKKEVRTRQAKQVISVATKIATSQPTNKTQFARSSTSP
jgi:hypothetical protein